MDFTRILVAVDALNGRSAAFERAVALARRFDAELYLLLAVPVHQGFSFRAKDRFARKLQLLEQAERAGVRAHAAEQSGDPAEIIELHANSRRVDLIVIGSEPQTAWGRDRSLVADRVIRRTQIPTLVIAGNSPEAAGDFRHVMAAVDLSPASRDVLEGAVRLIPGGGAARLTVLHAGQESDAARADVQALLSGVPAGVEARIEMTPDSPAGAILEKAASLDVDLVVVGRSQGFKLFGSTARRVLRRSERALLVVPGTESTARTGGQHAA